MNERLQAPQPDDSRYRLLVEAVFDYAIYMIDPTGLVASWNPGARRFKGYEADEILGRHFSQFYGEDDRAAGLPERALRAAAVEGRFEGEGWRIRKDGTRFWAHVVIDPIRTTSGDLIGFAKITRDLTDRREAYLALRRSEEQFRLLVQGVTDYAIFMIDRQGIVTSWNPGAQRIKGYAAGEIIGESFARFYTPEDRAAGEPARALAVAEREGRVEMEGWRVRKDGSRFRAHVVIDAVRDDSGAHIGFAKVTRDVTERARAEQALERAREALIQSQKMDALGQITGGVAHDFNNLLTAILGSLELVQKRIAPDPKVAALIDNAMQGARRGTVLTQRMLAFARRQALTLEPIDLARLVEGMSELMERALGPTVRIVRRFPQALPPVLADANQIELALLNLAVNARDAMPEGGTIEIAAGAEAAGEGHATRLPPGDYVRLSVADTGEGMDEETLARATEPFFTTKGAGKGTGLGLSMVHGVVEQCGGRLALESRRGTGTTATLWLPVARLADGVAFEPGVEDARSAAPSRGRVILAVDDDALVLMNTAAMLEDLGHEVVSAASGAQAMEIVRSGTPLDLVITDQAMPGMTGAQLARAVRAARPGLRIVLATGYAEKPGEIDGDVVLLSKPFTLSELEGAIGG